MRPRVGHIQFINCFPLFYGLIEKKFLLEIDLIKGTPTDLNQMLRENKLDLAPISSIAYAYDYKDYVLMPDISISCNGEVKSIYLFSKRPIEELDGKKIALSSISATSVNLLKIIMHFFYNIKPDYFISAPEIGAMLMEAEAALLIGDDALRAKYKLSDRLYVYDLGQIWKEQTDLPMVFAVWAVRQEFAEKNLKMVKIIKDTFTDSIKLSLEHIYDVAAKAAQWEDFTPEYLVDYFQKLKFDFDKHKQEGLMEYYHYASKLGIISEVPPLKILDI
ncbi:menaquinone biosynthesis protein [Thermosyntropha sp.]|uniref:menaquinone biosynthetic enzyme MqnA/MqnD family protein n=1 Tax=Thermosyntropha sp. TaxID=2740820 RepID=UPI0025D727E7|nr:menaquinone biosynthesis protein [Thermosyntropha sp.]MBO8158434.1 menaquinone biosynthesis protein [Thermosyntropha sp.]